MKKANRIFPGLIFGFYLGGLIAPLLPAYGTAAAVITAALVAGAWYRFLGGNARRYIPSPALLPIYGLLLFLPDFPIVR